MRSSAPVPRFDTHALVAAVVADETRIAVERTLGKTLTANEARVVRLRFGLGVRACRVSEIARRLGVRVTTVLRLEARALRKLRDTAMAADARRVACDPAVAASPWSPWRLEEGAPVE